MPAEGGLCRVFCQGIHSCHWRQRITTSTDRYGRKRACCWFCIVTVVSVLALGWLYICMVAYNDRDDVNWMAFKALKLWVNWFVAVMVLSALLAFYSCFLLLCSLILIALGEPLDHLHSIHKVLLCFSLLVISAGILGISIKWEEEWKTVSLSLQATGPFLQLGGVVALALLSGFVFHSFHKAKKAVPRAVIMATFTLLSTAVFLCPFFIKSPCLLEVLPPKPALIGHRGAPMLAPENTMMAFKKSAECGVIAFETDVLVSKDKVPFLMHDNKTLRRTTDVLQKFPKMADNASSSFTWKELQSLNAGSWFLKNDPFHTVSSLSEEERVNAENQSIPTLFDLLKLAMEYNVSIIFDLKEERKDSNDFNYVLDEINKSGIPHENVLWLPPLHRKEVMTKVPGFRQVYNNVSEMKENRGNLLNCKYSNISTEEIRQANMTVNLWVVNEPWLFSLLWCAGAHSVTTSACHHLQGITQPVWHMAPSTYTIVWICADVVSLMVMMVVFFLQKRRWTRMKNFQIRSGRNVPLLPYNCLDFGSQNTMKTIPLNPVFK